MSIVPLERVTFAGLKAQKDGLLEHLQSLGCLELIPLEGDTRSLAHGGTSSQAREALRFLLDCPQRRRQVRDPARFDAEEVERQALELQKRIQALESERDWLISRLADAQAWGDFQFPSPQELNGLRLWFYVVPHKDMPKVEATGLVWEVVCRDLRFCYVVVLAKTEPQSMPVPRVHLGSSSAEELQPRLDDVELALEDAQAERAHLTRWCLLFAQSLARLEDAAALAGAAQQTCDREPVFALAAWAPRERIQDLAGYAARHGFVFESRPPAPEQRPPTLMRNRPRMAVGEDLVNFYMTPGYWSWDPSAVVLVSFALFFAMILADAGYAAVMGVGLLMAWRSLGQSASGRRFRPLLALLVIASLIYGVLVGSYFGIAASKGSFLGRLHWLDMNNTKLMMGLAVVVGGIHVLLANVMDARRYADRRDGLAPVGWACAVGGGLVFAAGAALPSVAWLRSLGGGAIVFGLLLVVGFTAWREKPLTRIVQGLLGLTKISGAFGDVLSYLRLFALGLASASLALAFNDMAKGIRTAMPGIGVLLALLILVLGHALNLLLGISSGVIHGLRLNVIEFFNWGLKDEGRLFTPFRRKEDSVWNGY
jgi:V/A-type H+-transporting ATPase subunit I